MPYAGYAGYDYGSVPFIGGIPATITPVDLQVGIPFITGNDRYQVIVCADKGTSGSTPQFRYWFANGQQWGHELAGDTFIPDYFAVDENGDAVIGELQLTSREFEFRRRGNQYASSNVLIDHIIVDIIPRPTALTSESVSSSEPLGFTGHIESYGLTDYSRDAGMGQFSGTAISDSFTYQSTCGEQASDTWPAMRSVRLPVRMGVRSMNVRVVLREIRHVEIIRVSIVGEYGPTRDA